MAEKVVTAWGRCKITSGDAGEDGALGQSLKDVGKIKEDSTTLELVKGNVNELWGEGHELLDRMELEGSWSLKFTIYKASLAKIAEHFGLPAPQNDRLPMTTTIVQSPRSFIVTPFLDGAIGAELPNTSVSLTPRLVTKEGWTIDVEATTIDPDDEGVATATLFVHHKAQAASAKAAPANVAPAKA